MLKIEKFWYRRSLPLWAYGLIPFSLIFRVGAVIKKQCGRQFAKHHRFPIPIIVIGNISVGGTGKTPLTMAIAAWLRTVGLKPGIVSRGYKGSLSKKQQPYLITANDCPEVVGDEPYLMAQALPIPVVIAQDRYQGAKRLLEMGVDCVLSDDGLQHYRLPRNIEICVIDGDRLFGNGQILPLGPLREPLSRLKKVDFIVVNGKPFGIDQYQMNLCPVAFYAAHHPEILLPLTHFSGMKVHAVCGIGHPERFYASLKSCNISVIPHSFSDHHKFKAKDITFSDQFPILMTEKDMVKCQHLTKTLPIYALKVAAEVDECFYTQLLAKIKD